MRKVSHASKRKCCKDTQLAGAQVFYFAKLHGLSPMETIALFAQYAAEVEASPMGTSHPNIRAFASTGWAGVTFEGVVLTPIA